MTTKKSYQNLFKEEKERKQHYGREHSLKR